MMRYLLLLIVCCWLDLSAQSLPRFNRTYNLDSTQEMGTNILQFKNGYVIAGTNAISWTQSNINVLFCDSVGNPHTRKSYGSPGKQYYSNWGGGFIRTQDGGFALAGNIADSNGSDALLMKLDVFGDTLWTHTYGGDSLFAFYQCEQLANRDYILVGWTDEYDYWCDVLLIRTDSLGNELWRRTYGSPGMDIGCTVDATYDGGFLIGGLTDHWGGDYDQYLIKTDSMGNMMWHSFYGSSEHEEFRPAVIQLLDSNFLLVGSWNHPHPSQQTYSRSFFAKINTAGNVIWLREYGPVAPATGLTSVYENSTGEIIAAGVTLNSIYEGTIFKIAANGDSLWYRTYHADSTDLNEILNVRPTSDNGMMTAGHVNSSITGAQDVWAMKLDSMGCEIAGCNLTSVGEVIPASSHIVFPVPADEILNVQFSDPSPMHEISILDLSGREVRPSQIHFGLSTQLDISELPPGIYFVRIVEPKTKLVSVVPIVVH